MDKCKNRLVQQAVGFVKYFANLTACRLYERDYPNQSGNCIRTLKPPKELFSAFTEP